MNVSQERSARLDDLRRNFIQNNDMMQAANTQLAINSELTSSTLQNVESGINSINQNLRNQQNQANEQQAQLRNATIGAVGAALLDGAMRFTAEGINQNTRIAALESERQLGRSTLAMELEFQPRNIALQTQLPSQTLQFSSQLLSQSDALARFSAVNDLDYFGSIATSDFITHHILSDTNGNSIAVAAYNRAVSRQQGFSDFIPERNSVIILVTEEDRRRFINDVQSLVPIYHDQGYGDYPVQNEPSINITTSGAYPFFDNYGVSRTARLTLGYRNGRLWHFPRQAP